MKKNRANPLPARAGQSRIAQVGAKSPRIPKGIILFDKGRTIPRSDSTLFIELLAQRMLDDKHLSTVLCGHANLRESSRSAELMGLMRARRVQQILKAYGVAEARIETQSSGCRIPLLDEGGKCLTALSRRVEVLIR